MSVCTREMPRDYGAEGWKRELANRNYTDNDIRRDRRIIIIIYNVAIYNNLQYNI